MRQGPSKFETFVLQEDSAIKRKRQSKAWKKYLQVSYPTEALYPEYIRISIFKENEQSN